MRELFLSECQETSGGIVAFTLSSISSSHNLSYINTVLGCGLLYGTVLGASWGIAGALFDTLAPGFNLAGASMGVGFFLGGLAGAAESTAGYVAGSFVRPEYRYSW